MDLKDKQKLELAANTIRILSAEAVERAKSGHPGMPMGMAELGLVLWLSYLRFNPQEPRWLGRDRFVLSNGHGSMLLYSLLHLCGYDLSLEDVKRFRQWESRTPGHPENYMTPGVETTTGPLGQGVGNAVGMALAQKLMSARYTASGLNPFDHRVYCFCGDGCLMEGVSGEASSLAGHLGLNNLIMVYDDNEISIAGNTDLAFTEHVGQRYEAYGWFVQEIDGHDFEQIDAAYARAVKETSRPSFIIAHTTIGKGSPNKANDAEVHGSPLGANELKLTKQALHWPPSNTGEANGVPQEDLEFFIPPDVFALFASRVEEVTSEFRSWEQRYANWRSRNAELASRFDVQFSCGVPEDLEEKLIAALPKESKPVATRKLGEVVLQAASANMTALIGGSADLEPSTLTLIKGSSDVGKSAFTGLNLRFGVREHGMGAIMNGLSYYGGFHPYGATFFCFLDYMRPAVRLACIAHLRGLFIYTHDSVFLGEDGPTHQPIEHLAILRATPRIWVFRPGDGLETAICYAQALQRNDGPCAMILTRQNLEPLHRPESFARADIRRGAYILSDAGSTPEVILVASGSEVPLAAAAAKLLGGIAVRVVSMPCWEIFRAQPEDYRKKVLPPGLKKVVIEAASPFGWNDMLDTAYREVLVLGVERFGVSAPYAVIAEKLGFTAAQVAARVNNFVSRDFVSRESAGK